MSSNRRITKFFRPSSRGDGASSSGEASLTDCRLPLRLFATDRYPDARLNIYSKPDILCWISKYLKGTPQLAKIKGSCFGGLFEIPVHRSPISCKLVHALLCRQLVTKKKYEMWTVFGGQPMRFGLPEFGFVTGLPCQEFPEGYDPDEQQSPAPGIRYFYDEFVGDRKTTLADLAEKLKTDKKMDGDRKLGIALILIVDGVLIAQHQTHRPTFKYVQMLESIDDFLAFPWGRESFLKTIAGMLPGPKVPGKVDDQVNTLIQQLQQKTKRVNGFPLALQLVAFRNISGLVHLIPGGTDSCPFTKWTSERLPGMTNIQLSDLVLLERDPELTVNPIIEIEQPLINGWGEWDDEVRDRKVDYILEQFEAGHIFSKPEWPGGYNELDLIVVPEKKQDIVHQKHIVNRKRKMSAEDSKSGSRRRLRASTDTCKRKKLVDNDSAESIAELKEWMESRYNDLEASYEVKLQKVIEQQKKLEKKLKAKRFHHSRKLSSRKVWGSGCRIRHSSQQERHACSPIHRSVSPYSPLLIEDKSPVHEALPTETPDHQGTPCGKPGKVSYPIESPPDLLAGGTDWNIYLENVDVDSEREDPMNENQSAKGCDQSNLAKPLFSSPPAANVQAVVDDTTHNSLANEDDQSNLTESLGATRSKPDGVDVVDGLELPVVLKESIEEGMDDKNVMIQAFETDVNESGAASNEDLRSELAALSPIEGGPIFDTGTKEDSQKTPVTAEDPLKTLEQHAASGETLSDPVFDTSTKTRPDVDGHDGRKDYEEGEGEGNAVLEKEDSQKTPVTAEVPLKTLEQLAASGETLSDPVFDTSTKSRPDVDGDDGRKDYEEGEGEGNAVLEKALTDPKSGPSTKTCPETDIPTEEGEDLSKHDEEGEGVEKHNEEAKIVDQRGGEDVDMKNEEDEDLENIEEELVDTVELSDSSPARKPENGVLSEDEKALVKWFLGKPKRNAMEVLAQPKKEELLSFKKTLTKNIKTTYITPSGYAIGNEFLSAIARPKQWVNTAHMEVLVDFLARRHTTTLAAERSAFIEPWFTNCLQGKNRSFKAAVKKENIRWPDQIQKFVCSPGSEWFEDLDQVYVPMCWKDRHWVGLVINLDLWMVEIYDPNYKLYSSDKVEQFIKPITHMLPYVIKIFCKPQPSQKNGVTPFIWKRVEGIYANERSGDCGPLAAKLLEMHATGASHPEMADITDDIVDGIRGQFAMDIYQEEVVPLYGTGNGVHVDGVEK